MKMIIESSPLTAHTLTDGEKTELERLIASYVPPTHLRPKHIAKIKRIKSLQQARNGKVALCCLCSKLGDVDDMDVHHLTHNTEDNRLEVLEPAHGICNDRENGTWIARQRKAYAAQRTSLPIRERELG